MAALEERPAPAKAPEAPVEAPEEPHENGPPTSQAAQPPHAEPAPESAAGGGTPDPLLGSGDSPDPDPDLSLPESMLEEGPTTPRPAAAGPARETPASASGSNSNPSPSSEQVPSPAGPTLEPPTPPGSKAGPPSSATDAVAAPGRPSTPAVGSETPAQANAPASTLAVDTPIGPEAAFEPEVGEELAGPVRQDEVDGLRPTRATSTTSSTSATNMTAAATRTVEGSATRTVAEASAPESTAPLRSDVDRAAEILRQVRLHVSSEKRQALIHLEPKNLGRIAVRMAMREGRLTAVVQVERPETLRALERQAPELRAALGAQNIETESFDLMLGFGREEAGAQTGDSRSRGQGSESSFDDSFEDGVGATEPQSALAQRIVSETGVDTYV